MATFTGTSGNDNLAGTAPDLVGNVSGADLILGQEGDDNITGFGGQDSIYGGKGNDNIVYGQVQVLSDDPNRELIVGGLGFDNIVSNGSRGLNTIYGGAGTSADSADGGNSIDVRQDVTADVIFAGGGGDTIQLGTLSIGSTVTGGVGNDVVTADQTGGTSHAFILGNQGNDILTGSSLGGDTLYGGKGNDSVSIGSGFQGTSGSLVSSDLGNDTILDTADANFVGTSGAFTDSLYGGQGNDSIVAGIAGANELIFGGLDSDTITVGGQGTHTVYGGSDTIGAVSDGANTITGTAATNRDLYVGGGGTDSIVASTSTNVGAATTATSFSAVDTLTGGAGNDTFSFGAANGTGYSNNDALVNATQVDSITDFVTGQDKIRLASGIPASVDALSIASQTNINNAATLFDATKAAEAGLAANKDAAVFTYGGGSYLVVDAGNDKNNFTNTDYLVKINVSSLALTDFIA